MIVYGAPSVSRMAEETWGFSFWCACGIRPLLDLKVQLIQEHNYGALFVSELIQIAFKSFWLQCCNFYLEIVPWVNASAHFSCAQSLLRLTPGNLPFSFLWMANSLGQGHLRCKMSGGGNEFSREGGKGGIVIPFHAQILTKFTRHVLNQSLSEKPQGNEIFTTKHK